MSLAVINLFFFVPDLSCCAEIIIFFWKERDSDWRNVRRCSTNLIFSLEFLFMEHFIRTFRAENFNLYEKSKEK